MNASSDTSNLDSLECNRSRAMIESGEFRKIHRQLYQKINFMEDCAEGHDCPGFCRAILEIKNMFTQNNTRMFLRAGIKLGLLNAITTSFKINTWEEMVPSDDSIRDATQSLIVVLEMYERNVRSNYLCDVIVSQGKEVNQTHREKGDTFNKTIEGRVNKLVLMANEEWFEYDPNDQETKEQQRHYDFELLRAVTSPLVMPVDVCPHADFDKCRVCKNVIQSGMFKTQYDYLSTKLWRLNACALVSDHGLFNETCIGIYNMFLRHHTKMFLRAGLKLGLLSVILRCSKKNAWDKVPKYENICNGMKHLEAVIAMYQQICRRSFVCNIIVSQIDELKRIYREGGDPLNDDCEIQTMIDRMELEAACDSFYSVVGSIYEDENSRDMQKETQRQREFDSLLERALNKGKSPPRAGQAPRKLHMV